MEIDINASPLTPPSIPAQSPLPTRRRINVQLPNKKEESAEQISPSSLEIEKDPSSTENERPSNSPSGTKAKMVRCISGCQIS
jgi:hypothetical protein